MFVPRIVQQEKGQPYGVIFTWMTIRAIELEIGRNLITDSFILALHSFIARRGKVKHNETIFKGAQKELQDATNLFQ